MFLAPQTSFVSLLLEAHVLVAFLLPWTTFGGFVDMDTPLDKRTTKSLVDNTLYHLVGLISLGRGSYSSHRCSNCSNCIVFFR